MAGRAKEGPCVEPVAEAVPGADRVKDPQQPEHHELSLAQGLVRGEAVIREGIAGVAHLKTAFRIRV